MQFKSNYKSPIGLIRIEGTENYISRIEFCDEAMEESKKTPALAKEVINQLKAYFDGKLKVFDFPLKQEGTDFQQTVWNELYKIPFGKTCSYLTIAQQMNQLKSTRAIGNANGKNALAIVVPCHRVIGESGKLVGYAGGLWRKDWLLKHEAKIAHGVQFLF